MKQWIDRDALVLVVEHDDGSMSVTTRPERDAVWGPPVTVTPDPTLDEWQRRRRARARDGDEWTAEDVRRALDEDDGAA